MYENLIDELESVGAVDGVIMSDLLMYPEGLRHLLSWMMKQKSVQFDDLSGLFEQEAINTRQVLDLLIEKGLVEEVKKENEDQYQVPVKTSRNYRVPKKIWDVFDT
jgi:hypothetical protein